jgi:ATPase complex subunit ATP10
MSSAMPVAAVRPRAACLLCSARPQARRWYAAGGSGGTPPGKPKPPPPPPPSDPAAKRDATMYSVRIDAPRSYGEKMKTFTPQVIPRPIGMLEPPRPGENAGVDTRTPAEKRADALDYEKRLERRAALYG